VLGNGGGKVFLLCLSSVSPKDFFCTYFGGIPAVLTLFCEFGSAGAGNCCALGCTDAEGSATGGTGLLAMGAAGLAVGFVVGTEFLLGAGELGLGVGTLGKLGIARAPRTLRLAFGALFLAAVAAALRCC
jgi:hypothetical protein